MSLKIWVETWRTYCRLTKCTLPCHFCHVSTLYSIHSVTHELLLSKSPALQGTCLYLSTWHLIHVYITSLCWFGYVDMLILHICIGKLGWNSEKEGMFFLKTLTDQDTCWVWSLVPKIGQFGGKFPCSSAFILSILRHLSMKHIPSSSYHNV